MSDWCRCGQRLSDTDLELCYACKCDEYIKEREEKELLEKLKKINYE